MALRGGVTGQWSPGQTRRETVLMTLEDLLNQPLSFDAVVRAVDAAEDMGAYEWFRMAEPSLGEVVGEYYEAAFGSPPPPGMSSEAMWAEVKAALRPLVDARLRAWDRAYAAAQAARK
jgi:hypothetical protein